MTLKTNMASQSIAFTLMSQGSIFYKIFRNQLPPKFYILVAIPVNVGFSSVCSIEIDQKSLEPGGYVLSFLVARGNI